MASGPTAGTVGVVVTGGALGLAELLVALGSTGPGPVEAVAEAFIDLVPAWLKNVAVALFGTADKVALAVGMGLVLLALAALAGRLERRRRHAGSAAVVAEGLVAAAATATRTDGGAAATWPVLVGTVVGALVLPAVLAPVPDPAAAMAHRRVLDRRSLLLGAGSATVAGLVGASALRLARAPSGAPVPQTLPVPARPAPPVPADAELDVPDLTPFRTPNDAFYRIDTAFFVPRLAADGWRLRIHGMVDHEYVLTMAELLAAPLVEAWVTLACVSNEVGGDLVGNARWLGVPVREVLARAGVQPGADMVLSRSTDGFTAATPLEVLTDDRDALIAVGMNGEPLPPEHGFPARLVVPGLYGYVSATKWLAALEVTRFADAAAYWTVRGWSERGPVKLSSRIDVPRGGRLLQAGPVTVAGVAWAQHVGVAAVDVRVDEGPWRPAQLADDVSVDAWRQWVYRWDAEPGRHALEVRATDRAGLVQTGERSGVVPDGATGWHRIEVEVAPADV